MSAHNFLNNFSLGFLNGMLNNTSFFGFRGNPFMCNPFGFSGFGCFGGFNCFNIFSSQMNLFMVPNVMSTTSIFPIMQDSSLPSFDLSGMNFNEMFSTNIWDKQFGNVDTFTFQGTTIKDNVLSPSEVVKPFAAVEPVEVDFGFAPATTATSKTRQKSAKISGKAPAKITGTSLNDKYFDKMLGYILSKEGGYVNDPADSGGETNKGVTKATYDGYRRKKGLPIRNVREITDTEIKEIYYEFFKQSNADKIDDPRMALMVFDTAVGSGCAKAKELFTKSGGDIDKYEQLRRDWYADIVRRRPKDQKFIKGWNNRVTSTVEFANANLPDKSIA